MPAASPIAGQRACRELPLAALALLVATDDAHRLQLFDKLPGRSKNFKPARAKRT